MATVEWHIPFFMETPLGTITFNQFPGLMLDQTRCKASRRIRAQTDDIPQGDGEIFHTRFTGGYEMRLVGQPWHDEDRMMCPGQEELVDLRDSLYGHLWSLLRPESGEERVVWTPTGKANRMLNAIRLLAIEDPTIDEEGRVVFDFTIDTPFPYAMSHAQNTFILNGTGNVQNDGNVEFWPVIKVHCGGTCGAFEIENDFGEKIVFDASYSGQSIPGGSYVEIDTFRGTMFLDGDGADYTGGLVATESDFFPILPGANSISAIGAGGFSNAEFLVNDAFA